MVAGNLLTGLDCDLETVSSAADALMCLFYPKNVKKPYEVLKGQGFIFKIELQRSIEN